MRTIVATALGLALMAAAPAYAQSGQQGQGGKGTSAQSGTPHAMTQDTLRKQLQQAGFKDVQIIDSAYLVQAKTSDGNTVLMTVNPPMMSGSSASASTGSGSGSGSGSSQGSSGSAKQ